MYYFSYVLLQLCITSVMYYFSYVLLPPLRGGYLYYLPLNKAFKHTVTISRRAWEAALVRHATISEISHHSLGRWLRILI